jgi:hypothetical protein
LMMVSKGNSTALNHMEANHKRFRETGELKPQEPSVVVIAQKSSFRTMVMDYQFDAFKLLIIRWIVYCNIAFRMLEKEYFRELVCYLNLALGGILLRAASTLRGWIMEEYCEHKERLKEQLRSSLSNVHLSLDVWTSPNNYAIICVYFHFIDSKG